MELAYYISFLFFSVVLTVTGAQKDSKVLDTLWFLLLMGFSVVVRANPQIDIIDYYDSIGVPLEKVLHRSSRVREFSFWGLSSILYSLLGSERLVFHVWDAMVFLIVLSVRRRLSLGWYFVPFFFVAFPSVLGFQNIYRQFLATLLIINAASYCLAEKKQKRWVLSCIFFLLFAGTVHWSSAALFLVVLFLLFSVRGWRRVSWLLLLIVFLLLPSYLGVEEVSNSGLDLTWMYCLFLMVQLLLLSVVSGSNGKDTSSYGALRFVLLYVSYIAIVGFVRMRGDLFYERLMLYFIPVVLVLILWQISTKTALQRALLLFILLLFSLPSFLFHATYALMCNE